MQTAMLLLSHISQDIRMKKMFSTLIAAALAGVGLQVSAQSAFEGFYGQLATGYESNQASNLDVTFSSNQQLNASNQTFGGAPLILGLGYNFAVGPKWVIGLGVDYSALTQTSSNYSAVNPDRIRSFDGSSLEASNRFSVFIAPGYAIDSNKLIYLKAGYSSLNLTQHNPNINNIPGRGKFPLTYGNQSKTVSGYVVGLGYKQIIQGGVYVFAEANYMSYAKASFSRSLSPAIIDADTSIASQPSVNSYQLLVGVGYRF
jgi:opacity protein-like surface antigen